MNFEFEATGIGSLPFKDAKSACRIIFDNFETIPFWPQLPRASFLENMYVQFSETLPGLVIDEAAKAVHIDTSRVADDIEKVYGKYLEGDLEFFKISQNYAVGFYEFIEHLKTSPGKAKFVKGQITGPISNALFLTDQNKKAVIYDRDLFEILTKVLTMKARWQIRRLKKLCPNVIIFLDEPYLAAIGSSYVNIDVSEAMKKLDEVVDAIKKDGALAGVHCCGNTDWSALLKTGIDILNFDAYNFIKEFSLFANDAKNFLEKGGHIAFGIVPSSDAIEKETDKSLAARLDAGLGLFKDKGITGKGKLSALVTPSCGLGTLDEAKAKRALEVTKALSARLRKR